MTDKKTTVKTNQPEQLEQKQNNSTKTETKRFSLSKLTKLVSQSALKALTPSSNNKTKDRRSYGSNCSSLSSISFQTDDANDTVEDEALEPPKVCNININLVKLIDRASPVKRKVPCMGVSSLMIKSLKAKNQSTSSFKPDLQLVSKPIVFNSNELKSNRYSTSNVYDKLDRNALNGSGSSNKPTPRKATPTYLRHQTTCRITVFNGSHKQVINTGRKHYSSSQLNDSVTYDQIIF